MASASATAPIPAPAGDIAMVPPDSSVGPVPVAGPPPMELRDPQFAGVVPAGGTWAVIIGINRYPGGAHDLSGAVNDANDMDAALAHLGVPGDHRLVIRDAQASAGVIRAAADWLVAHASSDAVAEFFYAGHVRQLSEQTQAVLAADGGLVTDADLAAHLQELRARRVWIAIAGCYGGGFTELLAPGRVLTAAAGAGQLAYENESFQRSYMGEYMVAKGLLGGEAPPTVQGAFAFATNQLAHDYPSRLPVEFDDAGAPIDLRPPGVGTSSAASAAPGSASRNPPTTSPPGKSSPPPTSPSPSQPPPGESGPGGSNPSPDPCTRFSFGTVTCHS